MPANAAAWYMAKRRFFTKTPGSNQNPLLPTLLKEYPKKFALKNNVVIFLEQYNPNVARYVLIRVQGLIAGTDLGVLVFAHPIAVQNCVGRVSNKSSELC